MNLEPQAQDTNSSIIVTENEHGNQKRFMFDTHMPSKTEHSSKKGLILAKE